MPAGNGLEREKGRGEGGEKSREEEGRGPDAKHERGGFFPRPSTH